MMKFASLLVLGIIGADPSKDRSNNSVEITRPESYSIRRFQEVIGNSNSDEEKTPQETLISLRAKLVIAQQRLQDLKTKNAQQQLSPPLNEAALVKEIHLRAAAAQVDHYSTLVARNEEKTLREKRQQRTQPARKSSTKLK